MLREHQEENWLPYELGAWEAFSKKRAAGTKKKMTTYWMSGIAAALALLLVAGGIWLSQDLETRQSTSTGQLAMEDSNSSSPAEEKDNTVSEITENEIPEPTALSEAKSAKETKPRTSDSSPRPQNDQPKVDLTQIATNDAKTESQQPDSPLNQQSNDKASVDPELGKIEKITKPDSQQSLVATKETVNQDKEASKSEAFGENVALKEELPKEPLLTDEEIEEILETPSFTSLALGLSPGYGATQNSVQATSGSSLGFGVMVDRAIVGKLALGSGVAVNYLNQASESQSYAQVAGFSSPVTEKDEIAQVQVDIPLYVKFAITRDQSISVQAGFSNLVTFNQSAETESSYTREIAVLDATSTNSSSFTLRSESVGQLTPLEVPQNRFYPFATANLGVNIRLFESKKTSYEVMPFYNYPLQEFSGYGEKLGIFGASFKVNFGNIKRK